MAQSEVARIRVQIETECEGVKYCEPQICIVATCNEVIALNLAIGRHQTFFAHKENAEVNRLLSVFQCRLVEHLPTIPLPAREHSR
jgi:hypothetical protein